jgi:hypothetical protein
MMEVEAEAEDAAEYSFPSKYFFAKSTKIRPIPKDERVFSYKGGCPQFSYLHRFMAPVVWKAVERQALLRAVADCTASVHTGSSSGSSSSSSSSSKTKSKSKSKSTKSSSSTTSSASASASSINEHPSVNTDTIDWDEVSAMVSGAGGGDKTPMECLMQYRNTPEGPSRPWNEVEVEALTSFVRTNGSDWAACAEVVGSRTPFQCISYYQQCVNNTMTQRDEWMASEDSMLKRAYKLYSKDWVLVSNCVSGRTPKQCQQRYDRFIVPALGGIKKGNWSADEERQLYIAAVSCEAPTAKDKGEFRATKGAFIGWKKVAEFVPTRDAIACREKWQNVLDPYVSRVTFTEAEDKRIMEICEEFENNEKSFDYQFWSRVALQFTDRTDGQIYRRWRLLTDASKKEAYLESKRLQKRYMPAAHGRNTRVKTENKIGALNAGDTTVVLHLCPPAGGLPFEDPPAAPAFAPAPAAGKKKKKKA